MTDEALIEAAAVLGTPGYVYFPEAIEERVALTRRAFPGVEMSYAIKANPNRALLQRLRGVVDRLDVSSAGEIARALAAGWSGARLSFTGPAKRDFELRTSLAAGVGHHVLESVDEAEALNRWAGEAGLVPPVLLRLTPDRAPRGFGLTMGGRACAFGVDEPEADAAIAAILELPHLDLRGLHCYAATQGLEVDPVVENLHIILDLFRAHWPAERTAEMVVVGGGFGIPCHEGETALDLGEVGRRTQPAFDALRADARFADAIVALELGRWLVGEAGTFVTRVVRTKVSRGTAIAMCDGGLHHHLAAAGRFGAVIPRNYPLRRVGGGGPPERVELVGSLCTTIDTLGRKAQIAPLAPGDLVAIGCSGAYGPTASPLGFISHPVPFEALATRTAEGWHIEDVTEGFAPPERADRPGPA